MRLSLVTHIALVLVSGFAVLFGLATLLWWAAGTPPLTGNINDVAKLALAITGGIGGAIALVVAYRKQHLGESAEQRENTKLFNERFSTAAEQLGHETAAVRLAGVYAMAGLADNWEAQRQTCTDVLCAYLRMHYNPDRPEDPAELQKWHRERQVRHTVIRVIATRLRPEARVSWQGHDFDFRIYSASLTS